MLRGGGLPSPGWQVRGAVNCISPKNPTESKATFFSPEVERTRTFWQGESSPSSFAASLGMSSAWSALLQTMQLQTAFWMCYYLVVSLLILWCSNHSGMPLVRYLYSISSGKGNCIAGMVSLCSSSSVHLFYCWRLAKHGSVKKKVDMVCSRTAIVTRACIYPCFSILVQSK